MKNVAAVVGGFTMSYPVDRFGRKFSFIFMNILMIACCITEMFAQTPAQWIAARLIDVSRPAPQVVLPLKHAGIRGRHGDVLHQRICG